MDPDRSPTVAGQDEGAVGDEAGAAGRGSPGVGISPQRRKVLVLAVVAVVILAVAVLAVRTFAGGDDGAVRIIPFDPVRSLADETFLTKLGPRPAGSEAEDKASAYLVEQFTAAGLEAWIEQYPTLVTDYGDASVTLYNLRAFPSLSQGFTHRDDFAMIPFSASVNGRFDLIDLGNGTDEAWQTADVAGKAVLVTNEVNGRFGNAKWASDKGAAAVLVQNKLLGENLGYPPYGLDDPAVLGPAATGSGGGGGRDPGSAGTVAPWRQELQSLREWRAVADRNFNVPALLLSEQMGEDLRAATDQRIAFFGRSTVQVDLRVQTTVEERPIDVVVAELKAKGPGAADFVMIGAHHDTQYLAPGAVDNTVGTVTVLESARAIASMKLPLKHSIRFATWGAEELGLIGSELYVAEHLDELKEHLLVYINFDMDNVILERTKELYVTYSDESHAALLNRSKAALLAREPDLATRYNITIETGAYEGGTDHATFLAEGLAGGHTGGSGSFGWEYHTAWDTIEHVNPESQRISAQISGGLALALAI